MIGLPPGGANESKFNLRLASLAARGVLVRPGVRLPKAPWAGLGVMFTKSAKLNCWPGVLNPAMKLPPPPPPPPGVDIMDDGRAAVLDGGVDGAKIRDDFGAALAGEGDVAKYNSKSAPSSPAAWLLRGRNERGLVGGGVRGGDEWNLEEFRLKECSGRR